ncbi:MAG: hypothetical protein SFY92_12180 [Verrucomicrobiae bacterium]|nr:hypothetical protein [Verrucomicrobiae bacterium]
MRFLCIYFLAVFYILVLPQAAVCGTANGAIRETAEFILSKFGKGAAGKTLEEVTDATAKAVARYGDDALPLLRKSGHAGFAALNEAGESAPDVIRLYARKGDEAIWVISEPKKLAIFIKHGDSAADALLKHPGIADTLIGRYGDEAVGALNTVSRQNAQRLSMVADNGLFAATPRSKELLPVIRQHGDEAMDFIWKNKGSLAIAAVLGTFLAEPQTYISGAKELIVSPVVEPIARSTNWTLITAGVLIVVFLPFIARSVMKARRAMRPTKTST